MIIPTSREDWESLSAGELEPYSDLQLKKALQEFFGLKSHVYFMKIDAKRRFIMDPDSRRQITEDAEVGQAAHKVRGAEHSGKPSLAEQIAERSEDRSYRFIGVERPDDAFTDPFSDRTGRVAYMIMDIEDGARFPTQKRTCKRLVELGRLADFDERVTAKKQKPAHREGHQTLEDIIAGGDDEVAAVAAELMATPEPESVGAPDTAPIEDDREAALDDILNSLPQ